MHVPCADDQSQSRKLNPAATNRQSGYPQQPSAAPQMSANPQWRRTSSEQEQASPHSEAAPRNGKERPGHWEEALSRVRQKNGSGWQPTHPLRLNSAQVEILRKILMELAKDEAVQLCMDGKNIERVRMPGFERINEKWGWTEGRDLTTDREIKKTVAGRLSQLLADKIEFDKWMLSEAFVKHPELCNDFIKANATFADAMRTFGSPTPQGRKTEREIRQLLQCIIGLSD
jgi:hypothetical protein